MILLLLAAVTGAAAHVAAGWRRQRAEVAALLALDLLLVGLALVVGDGDAWRELLREDAVGEWSTAWAFTAAGAVFAVRGWRGRGWARVAGVGLALFCLFVAGEEISWGQRVFAFTPPEVFLAENYQQEANLHNLLTDREIAGVPLDSRFLVTVICLVYGVLGAGLRLLPGTVLAWRDTTLSDLAPPAVLVPAWLLVAGVELTYPVHLSGEAAEWVLGATFLCDALLRGPPPAALPGWRPWLLLPASVLLGALTAPVMDRLVYGTDEEGTAAATRELAALSLTVADAVEPDLFEKSRVHKRIYTAVESGYLSLDPAATRDRYYLDPWANPYWILWDRDDDVLILYSFGPNRRRDIDTRPYREIAGDDIVFAVKAAPE